MSLSYTQIKSYVIAAGQVVGAFAVLLGLIWTTLGRPHVENFVIETVEAKDYASKRQVDEANRKIKANGATAKEVDRRTIRIETNQTRILRELEQQRNLNNQILLELRSRKQ